MAPAIDEILFLLVNLAIADYHAMRFNNGKTISHLLWGTIIGLVVGVFTWISHWNWFLCGALICERWWCFDPMLNFLRKPKKPFFYTHSGKQGSWLDSKIGNRYPYIFMGSLAGFIALNIIMNI